MANLKESCVSAGGIFGLTHIFRGEFSPRTHVQGPINRNLKIVVTSPKFNLKQLNRCILRIEKNCGSKNFIPM